MCRAVWRSSIVTGRRHRGAIAANADASTAIAAVATAADCRLLLFTPFSSTILKPYLEEREKEGHEMRGIHLQKGEDGT